MANVTAENGEAMELQRPLIGLPGVGDHQASLSDQRPFDQPATENSTMSNFTMSPRNATLGAVAATPRSRGIRRLLIPGIAAAVALAACGSGSSANEEAAASGGERIQDDRAWARTSPAAATTGATYLVLTSAADEALIGASVDASIAGDVQIHETTMVEDDATMDDSSIDDSSMDESDHSGDMGVMQMQEVGRVDLPAGQAVALEPGGFHIMMLDLPAPLEAGQTFELTLDFEKADDMVLIIEVRDDAPAP